MSFEAEIDDLQEQNVELKRMLLEWHRVFTGADLCAGCEAEWSVSLQRVDQENRQVDEDVVVKSVVSIPAGQRRKWKSPEDQIEWLKQRVESMQEAMQKMHDDHVEVSRMRLIEVKALHLANARNKRSVKSNQAKFHERDATISRLNDWLAKACAESIDYAQALRLIAAPKRPDGTWNRCREACQEVAEGALGHRTGGVGEVIEPRGLVRQDDLQARDTPRYYQDVAGEEDYIDVTESIEYLRQERDSLISTLHLIADAGTSRDNGWWFHETATAALNNLGIKESQ